MRKLKYFDFFSKDNRPDMAILAISAIVLLGYLVPLFYRDMTPGQDWNYFDAMSLFTGSAVKHYGRFPWHDPWLRGGQDILSNPQSRVFSPMVLLDILFNPHLANLLSLIIFGLAGGVGCVKLLRELGIGEKFSVLGAGIFMNSAWFAHHFSVGHVAFGSMQLFPWIALLTIRLNPKNAYALALLIVLAVLDGGIYTALFSVLLVMNLVVLDVSGVEDRIKKLVVGHPVYCLGLLLMVVCLVCLRAIPLLMVDRLLHPNLTTVNMPLSFVLKSLFLPLNMSPVLPRETRGLGFHEFGCYLGVVSFLLILFALRSKRFWRDNWKVILSLVFWFWVGSGWFEDANPWGLFQSIPLANFAHVQSRTWILMSLFWVILLAKVLEELKINFGWTEILGGFILGEMVLIHNLTFFFEIQDNSRELGPWSVIERTIQSTSLERTQEYGHKPLHYFKKNTGSVYTYETFAVTTQAKAATWKSYRGEVYLVKGNGEASITSYLPGEVTVAFRSQTDRPIIELNTNHLFGWKFGNASDGVVLSHPGELLRFQANQRESTVTLNYYPSYLSYLIIFGILGLLLLFASAFWLKAARP